jgi:hypothetical protein
LLVLIISLLYFYFQRKASAGTRHNIEKIFFEEHLGAFLFNKSKTQRNALRNNTRVFILLRETASNELQNERHSSGKVDKQKRW